MTVELVDTDRVLIATCNVVVVNSLECLLLFFLAESYRIVLRRFHTYRELNATPLKKQTICCANKYWDWMSVNGYSTHIGTIFNEISQEMSRARARCILLQSILIIKLNDQVIKYLNCKSIAPYLLN